MARVATRCRGRKSNLTFKANSRRGNAAFQSRKRRGAEEARVPSRKYIEGERLVRGIPAPQFDSPKQRELPGPRRGSKSGEFELPFF